MRVIPLKHTAGMGYGDLLSLRGNGLWYLDPAWCSCSYELVLLRHIAPGGWFRDLPSPEIFHRILVTVYVGKELAYQGRVLKRRGHVLRVEFYKEKGKALDIPETKWIYLR